MANQGLLGQLKPGAATNALLYGAPIDSSASAVLTIANDGTGSAYDVALKNYDQKLTVDGSSYLLHKGDLITGYKVTVGTPIGATQGFEGTLLLESDDGEKSFKFESFYIPDYTEVFVKSVSIRQVTVESVSGNFAVGETLSTGTSPNDTTAVIYAVVGSVLYIGPSTINGAGVEFAEGDTVSSTGGAGATISVGGIGAATAYFAFSTTTAGGTYDLFVGENLSLFNDRTYRFNVSDSSMTNHLFRLAEKENGEWGPDGIFGNADDDVEYTVGKTTNGTAGNVGAYVQVAFTITTPTTLYFYDGETGTAGNSVYGGANKFIELTNLYTYSEFFAYDVSGTWANNVDSFTFGGTTYTVTAQVVGPYGYVRSYSGTTLTVVKGDGSSDFAGTDTFLDVPRSATATRSTVTVSSVDVATTAVEDANYITLDKTNTANNVDRITSIVVGPGERLIVNSTTANNVFSLIGFEDTTNTFPVTVFGSENAG
jgi:hypothetical protein